MRSTAVNVNLPDFGRYDWQSSGKKCWIRVSRWRFLGRGAVKTPLETPAWEANLDLLKSPIPRRQDHSQTIYGQPLFHH